MPNDIVLDRETYRSIKKMDRSRLEKTLQEVYVSGKEDSESKSIDFDELKSAIGQIKGIGVARLNEIMNVIQGYMDANEDEDIK